jgi:hypothetical protein
MNNLTSATWIIAGSFLAIQIVIFMVCLSRISQVKNEEMKPSLKLNLLDNEDNLFDLGLYIGLGGTVLSLILLLVLGTQNDALIGAYFDSLRDSLCCCPENFLCTTLPKPLAGQAS